MQDAAPEYMPLTQASPELEALFAGNAVGMATGQDTLVFVANDEFLRIVGRGRDDLTGGLDWAEITPSDHLERDAAGLGEVARSGAAVVVKDFLRPDGSRVPVLAAVTAVEQRPYRWIAVVVELSQDRWLTQLAEADAAIVSTLLEDAPVGFAFISPDLRSVRVNRELAAMNGFSVAEHEGSDVFDLVPGIRQTAEPLLRRVLETGEPLRDVEIVGSTPADPDREHIWLESFFAVRAPQGPVVGVAAIARDVTDLRAVERRLADTLERQRQALEGLQRSLMPQLVDSARISGVEVAARYLPAADEVRLGGDWFDVALAPDGRVVLSVGDVVGHGLEAVGLMARVSASVRAFVHAGHGPAASLGLLNRLLCAPDGPMGLATAVALALDPATGEVEYANAGHPCAVLHDPEGQVDLLECPEDLMLGVDPDATYTTLRSTVTPGGGILLYTDGLVERPGESLDDGVGRLLSTLQRSRRSGIAGERLMDVLLESCLQDEPQRDDICLLDARYLGLPG